MKTSERKENQGSIDLIKMQLQREAIYMVLNTVHQGDWCDVSEDFVEDLAKPIEAILHHNLLLIEAINKLKMSTPEDAIRYIHSQDLNAILCGSIDNR